MISLEDFHQNFLQSILSDAESRGIEKSRSFFEHICEDLIESGDLTNNYTEAEFIKKGIEVYGYDYDEERSILSLLVHEFYQEDIIQTLGKTTVDSKFKKLVAFYNKCITENLDNMEKAYESYSMAFNIKKYYQNSQISKIRLMILTDGKATKYSDELVSKNIGDIPIEFRVVDINYLYKIYLSENTGGDFSIDVKLPALEIETGSEEYSSFLTYIKGEQLVDIYEEYGQKLFEQNVRTFLQFRGQVNKGLKYTIDTAPEKFFAYNNGITATASDIKHDEAGNITEIKNFQIVNGAQTTSAIYASSVNKKNPVDVSNVSVQMKLSIVRDEEKHSEFVSKVSEYANTQNKVNKSDFFSNSPFHKEIKQYSKSIWVPAVGGSQKRTHWFYERVRGEYLNAQTYLTDSQKKQFQLENPKKQFIDKKLLGKSENTWRQAPYIVSKGAEFSFVEFAKYIDIELDKNSSLITEDYFKDAICRIIMFKELEKLVSKASWYGGGYRANIVTYSIAYLSYIIENKKKFLNFKLIWDAQCLLGNIIDTLAVIAEKMQESITNPPVGSANISQWAKKNKCWDVIKKLHIDLPLKDSMLLSKEAEKIKNKNTKEIKLLDSLIAIEMYVLTIEASQWDNLDVHIKKNDIPLSSMQKGVLAKQVSGGFSSRPASPKQCKVLYNIYIDAINNGVCL